MNRKLVRWVGLVVAALVIVALAEHLGGNSSPASQVSKYYRDGYSAGGKFSDGGGDNVTTNVYCTEFSVEPGRQRHGRVSQLGRPAARGLRLRVGRRLRGCAARTKRPGRSR